ncbi:hypothetical protein BC938DRAFT_482074 [Jimgerdemannia flammicorona]|uniref:N-acetylglucosaminylphosphatidylinositol deacetylase n=1 Tax=Jimgerdemannia flammicorona TaxID=994334 RepID=A0A433QEQ6_9FUNG|nr:hypothetical protein BC938DRAFT_482074 [Jimgerdemannia flammicorona]
MLCPSIGLYNMLALVLTVVVALSLFTYCLYLIPPSSTPLVPTTPPITNSRILLLTAHPDDECMFFGPTLLKLAEKEVRNEIWGLCLSTGNFDGIGHIRKYELIKSYQTLGVDPSHVTVLDHSELQDGMKNNWRPELVAEVVKDVVKNNSIDVVSF